MKGSVKKTTTDSYVHDIRQSEALILIAVKKFIIMRKSCTGLMNLMWQKIVCKGIFERPILLILLLCSLLLC